MNRDIVSEPIEFEWDSGNINKNFKKHRVVNEEIEEIFLSEPLIYKDPKHSKFEKRYDCLGETDKGKKLFVSFTLRNHKIRVISARSMSKKERIKYEKEIK